MAPNARWRPGTVGPGQRRAVRLAALLWMVWAVLTWNVVFDHVLVVAGREYLVAAGLAARDGPSYARVADWMHPAVARGVRLATASAAAILLAGGAGLWLATRRPRANP
jgi:hypothetical protein